MFRRRAIASSRRVTWSRVGVALGLAVVMLGSSVSASLAAVSPLDKPANQLQRADFEEVVRLTFTCQLTVHELDVFIDSLSTTQRQEHKGIFMSHLESKASKPCNSAPGSGRAAARQPVVQPLDGYSNCLESGTSTCWKQQVEYSSFLGLEASARPSSWYSDLTSCDNDSTDYDYTFYIPIDLYGSPDRARSASTDPVIANYLQYEYINGWGYSYYEIRLCTGDSAVNNYGGPWYSYDQVYGGRSY